MWIESFIEFWETCWCHDYIPRKVYGSRGASKCFNSENVISLDGKGVTTGHLFDKTEMKVFFDSGASKSYMLKGFYDRTEYLHRIPKMRSTCTGIKKGNGAIIPVEFVFPVQIMIQGHLFEIYTIVGSFTWKYRSDDRYEKYGWIGRAFWTQELVHLISCYMFNPNLPTKWLESQTRRQSIHKDSGAVPEDR